ncbi:MAG: quinolinate synthase NadA [Lentisphaerae bacterium]|nr:quinolinate synthase NadA [Lentisphaerota bacterium]
MQDGDIERAIEAVRAEQGDRLLILGHHYQADAVVRHADERGDSLELARKAAAHPEAERIVFCGVRFMAESADILTGAGQTVYMPETAAGCPMADMATAEAMEAAWARLQVHADAWLPVVYVNSSAAVKAVCGRLGGSACTSSNASAVFRRALDGGHRVFFLPDEHLGRNTAAALGVPEDETAVYDPGRADGGVEPAALARARVVVWKGFCHVHTAFTEARIRAVRRERPNARIIVHPETPRAAARLADARGSTSQIIRYVEEAPDGSEIVIGTERNLVERLAAEQRGRVTIVPLTPSLCSDMARTSESSLLEVLRDWPESREVHVPEAIARDARLSLERMLAAG